MSRTSYRATKKYLFEGSTVYGFPAVLKQQERLERSLPNKLTADLKDENRNIKKTVGVCS